MIQRLRVERHGIPTTPRDRDRRAVHPDAWERQAERVADQLGRGAVPARISAGGSLPQGIPVALRQGSGASGQPLPAGVREFFEARLGHDFRNVRVHRGPEAAASAEGLGAHAYTTGSEIVFGEGSYAPHTPRGRKILAHELTHVVQQAGNPQLRGIQRWPREVQSEMILARQQRARQRLATLETALDQNATQYNVAATILRGIIHYETLERGLFESVGELYRILREDVRVSLGPGDVQVQRAADLLHPGRDLSRNPLSSQEFTDITNRLLDPTTHAQLLARTLRDNYEYYGRQPGKTEQDRWRFAVAKHKGGHGPVGRAQERARNEGRDLNSWSDVSRYMDSSIVQFVTNVMSYSGTTLTNNPYL